MVEGEDVAVDLFAEANKAVEEEEKEQQEADEGDEPEDDFNAAWEVLDLARALYEKQQDEDEEIKLKLADTFIALGDVSLETGAKHFAHPLPHIFENSHPKPQRNSTKRSQTTPPVSHSKPNSCHSPHAKSPKRTTNSAWSSTSHPVDWPKQSNTQKVH